MRFDFDRIVERRGTDSVKWCLYEQDVLPLWVADMDFPSPPSVVEALRRRVEHGVFGYGIEPPELRGIIQARLRTLYGWEVAAEDMLFLPGVVVGFNLAARAFAEPGEGVLLQTPVYHPFFVIAPNTGRVVERAPLVNTGQGYEIDFDAFERAITPRTRVFLLCNPHNPVGRVFSRAELERLAEICLRHDLIICADEIHQDFVYSGHVHTPIAALAPEVARRTVTLVAPSKTFNIAGFHFSVALAADPDLRTRLRAAGGGVLTGRPGVLDFVAALAAYQGGGAWLAQVLAYLQANRDFLAGYVREHLAGISLAEAEGTYLAWLDCRGAGLGAAPGKFFLERARVALSEGSQFGAEGEGFVRLNFGCPRATLAEALDRMRQALARRAEQAEGA